MDHIEQIQRPDPATRPRPERLTGARVTLRPLAVDEVQAVSELLSHPDVARWWLDASPESLREELFGDPETFSLAVDVGEDLVGVIMYTEQLSPDYFSAGIDIALGASFTSRGLGTEALRLLAGWLVDVAGHHRLTIDPAAANERAIAAYEKVGFRPVGIMRRYEREQGDEWHDNLLMDLLAEELVRD